MASGPGSGGGGGFGRGGRGAALLQALAKSSQKPGQTQEKESFTSAPSSNEPHQPLGLGAAAPAPAPQTSTAAPMGRGSLIAGLRQSMLAAKQQQVESSPQPTAPQPQTQISDDPPMPMRMGRGLAAMKTLLAQQQSQGPSRRGQQASSSRELSTPSSLSSSPPPKETEPPTEKLAAMGLGSEKPQRHAGPIRKPTITKLGELGRPMELSANYIRVLCQNSSVYHYHVAFSPVIDNRKLKYRLLNEHKDILKVTDGFDGNSLFLPHELPEKEMVFTSQRHTDGAIATITVTFIKILPPEQCSQVYNVVFRKIMHILGMVQVQRHCYNPHTPASVPQHKLEVWPGYITAVKEQEGGLMLLLDASHKVLRTETVHDIMEKAAISNPQGFQDEIIRKIVGSIVLTRYNNKTYKVDDVVWSKTPMDRFSRGANESTTFVDYYKTQYNIDIQNKSQPLLLHKKKPFKGAPPDVKPDPEFLCLIPELCYMSGLTDDIRQNFTIMKDLAIHTRVTPAQRQTAMKKFVNSVNSSSEARASLSAWGLGLDSSTVHISGRRLPPEKIFMGRKEFSSGDQADWSREATRNELISPVNLLNWGVFFCRKDAAKANEFLRHMQAESRNLGINCQVPFRRELANEKIETLVQELRSSINDTVQLVVVINPTNRNDRYTAIKKVCCVEAPVPSQVIISKTISRPDRLRSVVQKIALQINCKLGGELWAVKIPLKSLMVVGIDSFHDPAKTKQSIGGFVSSMNKTCTRWYSSVCFQRSGQELVHGLQICLTSALRKFHAENHFLPEKIVIYRDGVGDGQLDVLADHEVKQLHRCFLTFGEEYRPQCTTICVQKRINTRIFAPEKDGSMQNPPPGTIVDHTVTRRDRYDFFIVSQHVRQGTVSPTHYIVVDDGLQLKPDHMQALTYKMTHLYYNWPGTVRVPAPCQYAHKLAYLVGESIHKEPAECLSDRLFFL